MEDKIRELLDQLLNNKNIRTDDIPNIELYMDQVTTLMEKHLSDRKRNEEDKIMTKTMINNYTKNHLLPPSNKKKYSREHIFFLIMIYYYKNLLSISDIQTILAPFVDEYFPMNSSNGIRLEDIYNTSLDQLIASKSSSEASIMESFHRSMDCYKEKDLAKQDFETLTLFSFISQLSFDIALKKQLIEKIIDQIYPKSDPAKDRAKSDKKKK